MSASWLCRLSARHEVSLMLNGNNVNVLKAAKVELHAALSHSHSHPHTDQQSVNFTREEPPNPVLED